MSNICERAGTVLIRLGGNTQEYARFHDGVFEDGRITQKEKSGTTQTVRSNPGRKVFWELSTVLD